jgi:hypothetical protein
MKNAKTTNHTTLSLNPDKHSDNDNVFVSTQVKILNKAITPIGKGFKIMPMIVATKIINKCQAFVDKVSSIGEYQAIDEKIKINNRIRFCF